MNIPVAILAGGLATRMRPLTQKIPKSLLLVAGCPFIDHQLRYLQRQGIRSVVICTGFLGEMIQAHVQDGAQFGISVRYSSDGEHLLGTGGALLRALPLLGQVFYVLYGDSYLPIEYSPIEQYFHLQSSMGLMTILRQNTKLHPSNVVFRQGVITHYDKIKQSPEMEYIDYGLSILTAQAFGGFPVTFDLGDVFHSLALKNTLTGYEVFHRFYEIGSFDGLQETEKFLLNGK